jgi:peptide/nickel transport system substrate-binding protein
MKTMIGQLRFDGLSRRGVLKAGGALGATALAGSFGRPARAEPMKGGTLRVGMGHGSTTDSLDPATWENAYTQIFAHARHNYLTEIAADGALQGEIAESWEASVDATTWTFRLRDGVFFHSGRAVNAADVIASLNHHRGDDSKSAAKPIVAQITDMRADGDTTVVITLQAGNADFPFILSDYHLPVLPAVGDGIDPTSADGCGPYVVERFEHGRGARLTRFDGYWKGASRAHFDAVELLSIIDPAARQNALITGEVDAIDRVDLKTVHLLQRQPSVTVLSVTGT